MATTKKLESADIENTANPEDDERVMVMVPYVEGEDPDVTVIVNGYITKFRRGEMVSVKKNVAEVLANSNRQRIVAQKNREKFKIQVTDL